MSPEYLRELADMVDHEQNWRLSGLDRPNLSEDQKRRMDAGVALRRHASHVARMIAAYPLGKSVCCTPMSEFGGSQAVCTIDPPANHQRLLDEQNRRS